ncbi:Ropporin-1-like protein, partial [Gonioctena quinquepunctata]
WSTAYFRCLSLNIPPPVKPRLEYPVPRDYYGLTPGWLKALLHQLQSNRTISFMVLWDRWTGACLTHNTLIQILCVGGFENPEAIPWMRFIGLCAAHLTDDLTNTMKLICEIMTEEPEGGSAMIPLETFLDLYKFLARIDASKSRKLENLYFSDTLLGLSKDKPEKDELSKESKEESVYEEESIRTQESVKTESEESVKRLSKGEISCPSLVGDDNYSVDYYIRESEEEQQPDSFPPFAEETIGETYSMPGEGDDYYGIDDDYKGKLSEGDGEREVISGSSDEGRSSHPEKEYEGEGGSDIDQTQSVETILEKPRKIEPEGIDEEKNLLEDLEKLKALQQEIAGETDEEVEKFKCKLIQEMPLTESQQDAIKEFQDAYVVGEAEESAKKEESQKDDKEKHAPQDVYIEAIPGIGPIVPEHLITAVCDYMKSVATIQHGMVMPRNIRHYNCPPLELLEY